MWWTPQPFTEVLYYQTADGAVPLLNWLKSLPPPIETRCSAQLARLADGPGAHYLRDGIYNLRIDGGGLLYRIFFFELSERAFVASHGCIGGDLEWETERAVLHRRQLIRHPGRHIYKPAG